MARQEGPRKCGGLSNSQMASSKFYFYHSSKFLHKVQSDKIGRSVQVLPRYISVAAFLEYMNPSPFHPNIPRPPALTDPRSVEMTSIFEFRHISGGQSPFLLSLGRVTKLKSPDVYRRMSKFGPGYIDTHIPLSATHSSIIDRSPHLQFPVVNPSLMLLHK